MFKTFFKNFDFLGPKVKLMVKGEHRLRTVAGGSMSITLIFTTLLAIFGFGRDIFEKEHPQIVFNKVRNIEPTFNFTGDTLFMFSLFDLYNNKILQNERKFNIYFVVQDNDPLRATGAGSLIQTFYPIDKCDQTRYSDALKPYLLQNITDYWCFPKNTSLQLKGSFLNGADVHIKLNVDICLNTTANNNSCLPPDQIRSSLGIFNFQYIMFDTYMDGQLNFPGTGIIQSGVSKTSINSFQRLTFWLKQTEYFTDNGWLLQDTRIDNYVGIDRIGSELFLQENTTTFFSHIISLSNLKDQYYRSYIKAQAIMSFVGGFLTFIKFILICTNNYLAQPFLMNSFQKAYLHKIPRINQTRNESCFTSPPLNMSNFPNFMSVNNFINNDKSELGVAEKTINNDVLPTINQNTNNLPELKIGGRSLISRKSGSKSQFRKFKFFQSSLRGSCFKTEKIYFQTLQLKKIERKFAEQISLEALIKTIRQVNIMEGLIFEEYQNSLFKYIPFNEKIDKSGFRDEEYFNELSKNVFTDKLKLNEKLCSMLEM